MAACGGTTAATPIPTVTGDAKGEGFEFRYVCVNRTLLSCQVVQQFMDSVRARTNGQIDIQLSSYPECGIRGFDMIHLLKDGSLGLGEIYSGLVGGEFPVFEAANLWGAYESVDQWFAASEALRDDIRALVTKETGGGKIVGFNYYASNYFLSKGPLNTLADYEGAKTRSHSTSPSDLIGPDGLGADPQTMAFADVYPALERGDLDGAVTCGSCAVGQKWFEVTDYLTGPIPGTIVETYITFSGKEWNSLPAHFQEILLEEGVLHTERAKGAALDSDVKSEGDLVGLGMKHSNFTSEMLGIFKDAARDAVIPEWADRAGGFESEPVQLYNTKIGPITGLYIQHDGTVSTTVE